METTRESMDFSVEEVEVKVTNADNSNVQAGCWGDTGSGAYC